MDLFGGDYLTGVVYLAKKNVPIYGRLKEGVTNIQGTTSTEVSEEHAVFSIDNQYHFSGRVQFFIRINHTYMDTRFIS